MFPIRPRIAHFAPLLLAALVTLLATSPARADNHEIQRMTLPKGKLLVQAFVEVNLSADAAFKPVSLAPDIWYGVLDKLSVGLLHSANGATGIYGGVGSSLCLTGEDNGCDGVYHNLGLNARYNLLEHSLPLAIDGGVFINDFDPFLLNVKLGVVGKWQGPIAVIFNPTMDVGLTEREAGNKDTFIIPVAAMYDITNTISVGLQTGVVLPFADLDQLWRVPLTLGGRAVLTNAVWVEAAFTLPAVVGGDGNATGFDGRVFTLGGGVVL
ncbi:MAG: hypothetical protein Tsb0020_50850 [Haliangiales bacterium]